MHNRHFWSFTFREVIFTTLEDYITGASFVTVWSLEWYTNVKMRKTRPDKSQRLYACHRIATRQCNKNGDVAISYCGAKSKAVTYTSTTYALMRNHYRSRIKKNRPVGMRSLFWIHRLNTVLAFFLSNCVQYRVIFDRGMFRVCSLW